MRPTTVAAAVIVLTGARVAGATEPVRSGDLIAAAVFLETYRAASEAQSASLYDLYSDRAVIYVRNLARNTPTAFQGKAYKAWGTQLLAEGHLRIDRSEFRDVMVEQRAARLVIHAKRYSSTRCNWDLSYVVALERENTAWRIMEERLSIDSTAHCAAPEIKASMTAQPASSNAIPATWTPLSSEELSSAAARLARELTIARTSAIPRSGPSGTGESAASPTLIVARRADPNPLVLLTPAE